MEKIKKITPGEIMDLCVELNCDDFNVWCDYAGHINGLTLWIEPGGYKPNIDLVYLGNGVPSVYLKDGDLESLNNLKAELLHEYEKHIEFKD